MAYPVAGPKPYGGHKNIGSLPSPRCFHTGGVAPAISTDFTNTDVVTTTLYIAELFVPYKCFSTGVAILAGSTSTNGNVKAGIYDSTGTIVATTTAAATGTGDAITRFAWSLEFVSTAGTATTLVTALLLMPGTYYIATLGSSATDDFNTHTIGNFGATSVTAVTNATCMITTNLTITPPTTFTTAVGPVASLY